MTPRTPRHGQEGAFPICTAKPENPGFRLDFGRALPASAPGGSMPYTCGTPLVNALVASGGGDLDDAALATTALFQLAGVSER